MTPHDTLGHYGNDNPDTRDLVTRLRSLADEAPDPRPMSAVMREAAAYIEARTPPTQVGDDVVERLMREFYVSSAYDPKAARPADVVKAAIKFALTATRSGYDERESWGPTIRYCIEKALSGDPTRESLIRDLRNMLAALSAHQEDGRHE